MWLKSSRFLGASAGAASCFVLSEVFKLIKWAAGCWLFNVRDFFSLSQAYGNMRCVCYINLHHSKDYSVVVVNSPPIKCSLSIGRSAGEEYIMIIPVNDDILSLSVSHLCFSVLVWRK